MIDNIGIDIIENKRIENNYNEEFIDMILTDKEKEIFQLKIGKKKIEFICGRFAAKEAIIKALNKYENPHMKEIEIINEKNGSPKAIFKQYKILITIAHEHNYTIAEAILLK